MTADERLAIAAEEFLVSTDLTYDECSKGVFSLDRIIVGTPSALTPEARGYLVPMLYAYWERFFRVSFGEYLRCIALAKVPVEHLRSRLAALRINKELHEIADKNNFKHFHELCSNRTVFGVKGLLRQILDVIENPVEFAQPSTWVKTYSNVGFDVVQENCQSMGFDINVLKANFASKSLFASLKDLVDMRNDVAHGSAFKQLGPAQWEESKSFVLKIMQVVQHELYESLKDPAQMLDPGAPQADFEI